MNLTRFQSRNPLTWARAIELAQQTKPHVYRISPGTYRVVRRIPRAPKKDAECRIYFVELSTNGRDLFAECKDRSERICKGMFYNGICRHVAAVWLREERDAARAQKAA